MTEPSGGASAPLAGCGGLAGPVREFVLVDFEVELGDAGGQALLDIGHGLVVDQGADFVDKEAEQGTGGDVAQALIQVLAQVALQ